MLIGFLLKLAHLWHLTAWFSAFSYKLTLLHLNRHWSRK